MSWTVPWVEFRFVMGPLSGGNDHEQRRVPEEDGRLGYRLERSPSGRPAGGP